MNKTTNILLALFLFSLLFACKKGDKYYRNFENSIQVYDGNAYQYLESQYGVYDSLLLVLDRLTSIRDTVRNKEITLFAPTNQSFEIAVQNMNNSRKRSGKANIYLEDINKSELDSLMSRYIFSEQIPTDSISHLVDGKLVNGLNYGYDMNVKFKRLSGSGFEGGGQNVLILSDVNNSIFERYWRSASTNAVNIKTKNAFIHVISPEHDFGFGKLGLKEN